MAPQLLVAEIEDPEAVVVSYLEVAAVVPPFADTEVVVVSHLLSEVVEVVPHQ